MERYLVDCKELYVSTFHALRQILAKHKLPVTVESLQKIGIKGIYNFEVVSRLLNAPMLDQTLTAMENAGAKLYITTKQFDAIEFDLFEERGLIFKSNLKDVLNKHNALIASTAEIKTAER